MKTYASMAKLDILHNVLTPSLLVLEFHETYGSSPGVRRRPEILQ